MSLTEKVSQLKASSAHTHWLYQRLSALALLVLSGFWLVFISHAGAFSYGELLNWLSSPLNALFMALWLGMVAYHAALGLEVIFEDYLSDLALRQRMIKLSYWSFAVISVFGWLLILKLFMGS